MSAIEWAVVIALSVVGWCGWCLYRDWRKRKKQKRLATVRLICRFTDSPSGHVWAIRHDELEVTGESGAEIASAVLDALRPYVSVPPYEVDITTGRVRSKYEPKAVTAKVGNVEIASEGPSISPTHVVIDGVEQDSVTAVTLHGEVDSLWQLTLETFVKPETPGE